MRGSVLSGLPLTAHAGNRLRRRLPPVSLRHLRRMPEELRADLALLARSLERHVGARAGLALVRRALRRVDVFGFHLASLDVAPLFETVDDLTAGPEALRALGSVD